MDLTRALLLLSRLMLVALCLAVAAASPLVTASTYKKPQPKLADIVEAPPTPWVRVSPDREHMLLVVTPTLMELADLAQEELRLAGMRIRPSTNGRSRLRYSRSLTLMERASQKERPITGIPAGARINNVDWAPDSKSIAFTVTDDDGIALWVADVAQARARRLGDVRLNGLRKSFHWAPDSQSLWAAKVPSGRGSPPKASRIPSGPVIQSNDGRAAPARTYQDLLKTEHDERAFEYYMQAQLVRVTLEGKATEVGPAGMIYAYEPSPDGKYVHMQMLTRPFSYLVPAWRFPRTIEIWHADGRKAKTIAELPLQERVPIAFGSVPTGPRSADWRPDLPATLVWVEARDGGDARAEAEVRDELMALTAPFSGDASSLLKLGYRYSSTDWGNDELALVHEWWWKNRQTRTWRIAPGSPDQEPELLIERSFQDRYSDPGEPVTVPTPSGGRVMLTENKGRQIYLMGDGHSPEGKRPFVDRFDLKTRKAERLWQSEAPYYEEAQTILDPRKGILLTRRESNDQPPNYFTRDLKSGKLQQLTDFPHPTPQLLGMTKELLRYERADGVQLTSTLYLPPGYDKEQGGRLPVLLWAYPREFKSAQDAGQVASSKHAFDRIGWWSPLLFVAAGYAVLNNATMPIIGEGDAEPNDTYVDQLVASAKTHIDAIVDLGVADRSRIAVGGHSYGAFMAANLLAHSDLFAAGIARSGAYNRTLTPFGFQAEERTLWEAPQIYFAMSPFMHAEKINEPILLIHGDADNNSGTFPLQSRRFYHALKGHGATARLVMLPDESHGYRARESILHMVWEMERWLSMQVADADRGPRIASQD